MDFVADQLYIGTKLRGLAVVDNKVQMGNCLEFLGYPGNYPAVTVGEHSYLNVDMISKVDGAAIRLIKREESL